MVGKGFVLLLTLAGLVPMQGDPASSPATKELTVAEVKAMVQNMGYETKVIDEKTGKFEFVIVKDGTDYPIASEVSASKRYVWLTIFFGEFEKLSNFEQRAVKLLKKNFAVQPCQFYVTEKGSLMLGVAIDNRNVTPAILRRLVDKIVADASGAKDLWQ